MCVVTIWGQESSREKPIQLSDVTTQVRLHKDIVILLNNDYTTSPKIGANSIKDKINLQD